MKQPSKQRVKESEVYIDYSEKKLSRTTAKDDYLTALFQKAEKDVMQQIEVEAQKEKLKVQEANKYSKLASLKRSSKPKIPKTMELLGTGFLKEVLKRRNTESVTQETPSNSPEMKYSSVVELSNILTSKITTTRSTSYLLSPLSKQSLAMDVILHSPDEVKETIPSILKFKSFNCF